ncbi:hypothetical protein FOL47_002516 [Perkinsus chesapeaki]|uniref:Uncharacterized protein n=1 Tax=Perkinsus chesapeaki TaxID=330153 RepID=A0A7J6N121_PERCH|nr:hypothetical protein FOL47_002516 [Perkinsus chesapeaki]
MVAHAAPVTPFIYSENICCISDGHLLYYDDYVYKNTVCRIDILQETSPIIQFRFYDEIRQVKPASGYVFVLLRESDELYMIVNDDYTYITRLPEVPMYTHTDVFLDALVYDGEVTQVLYNPDGQHLCIWRPCFDEIFRAKVPGPCTCRFVPGTNGTVVAGVFTRTCNYEERRWFNAFHIYDGLVPAKGVPVGPGIVVSVIISLSCILLVKVVLYQREVKQGRVETYAFDSQWRLPLGPDPRPLEEDDVADIYPPGFEFYSANHPYNRCSIKYSADRKMIEYIKEPDYSSSQFDSDDDDDDEWAYYEIWWSLYFNFTYHS